MVGMGRKRLWVTMALTLLIAMWSQAALAQTLQMGSDGHPVRVLQVALRMHGYPVDTPSEPYLFDAKTKAAVKKFQAASGIAANEAAASGVVDDVTFDRVKRSDAVTYAQYVDMIHVKGGAGEEVLATKKSLKKLGYLTGTLTNQYDQATETAVSCFQRANGLYDSGNADRATREALSSDRAVSMRDYQQAAGLSVVRKGDNGEQVRMVQNQLSGLGYYDGNVNGSYNAQVVASVKLFQTANGLTASGVADLTTREVLNSGRGKDFNTYTGEQKLVRVAKGDSGYAVQLLQSRLKELYYYPGKVSGKYDAATEGAVRVFQQGNRLSQTGVADLATRKAMNAESAIDRVRSVGLLPRDNLEAVREMTERLRSLGYLPSATTKYSSAVAAAVRVFQKANGLPVTGKADPKTLTEMNEADAVSYDEYKNGTGNAKIERMIKIAYQQLGKPYRTGSACKVPQSFDCSRYTKYVFGQVGVKLSGEVAAQGNGSAGKWGAVKDMGDLRRGDLLFFDTQPGKKPIGHSAIFLGRNAKNMPQFIHASSAAGKVVVSDLSDWYRERFLFGVRVFK